VDLRFDALAITRIRGAMEQPTGLNGISQEMGIL
jgi:hypothetical protein